MPPATILRGSENGNRHSPTGREILTGVTRTMIDVTAPRPEQIHLADIARSLARQQRFTGHCPLQPTIAQHSLAVEYIARRLMPDQISPLVERATAERVLGRAALMHDAGEMIVSDINGAVKKAMRPRETGAMSSESWFDVFEARAMRAIVARFGCSDEGWEGVVHEADCLACAYEMAWDGWCPDAVPPAWVVEDPYVQRCYRAPNQVPGGMPYKDGGEAAFLRRAAALGLR